MKSPEIDGWIKTCNLQSKSHLLLHGEIDNKNVIPIITTLY